MANETPEKSSRHSDNTEIVGIRLTPKIANAFKAEAARRGLRVNQLFIEMWEGYKPRSDSTP